MFLGLDIIKRKVYFKRLKQNIFDSKILMPLFDVQSIHIHTSFIELYIPNPIPPATITKGMIAGLGFPILACWIYYNIFSYPR